MTPNKTDDDWLNVLAGSSTPTDHETRQSASLRSFFELQEQNIPKLDEATQRRILNALAAKGVFAQAVRPKPVLSVSLLARLMGWLFPSGHASGQRLSAVVAAIMAVTVLPFVLHNPVGDDDPGSIKSLPTPLVLPTSVIDSAKPERAAAQLVATLARYGVVAELRRDGADYWVTAEIPADRLPAIQAEWASMGLATQPDGQLTVQFRRQP